jgi:predicted nucleic acid-binding protein
LILAIDTDVLVAWAMAGSPRHDMARKLFENEVHARGGSLALTPQVLHEFLHVTTDQRRFENPLPMVEALRVAHRLWNAEEVIRLLPSSEALPRTLELMVNLRLGRKRILDTALAATLEGAGISRLATFNPAGFAIFGFLQLLPSHEGPPS